MIKKDIFNGVLHIQPVVYEDDRGSFTEIYNKKDFDKLGIINNFVQDNISFSKKRLCLSIKPSNTIFFLPWSNS